MKKLLRKWHRRKLTRDGFLFAFGIAGIIYETVAQHADRPSLLFVFGACIGLPAFLHSDEKPKVPEAPTLPMGPLSPEPSPPTKTPTRKRAPAKKTAAKKHTPAKKAAPRTRKTHDDSP